MSEQKYTPRDAGSGQRGICAHCNKGPSPEGHDGCLGTLPGPVMNACCGHGDPVLAYIQYADGSRIAGRDAVLEQERLMSEQKQQVVDDHNWLTNPYAMCECLMHDEWHARPELFPICTYFEDDGADLDICIACGHGEACHLKGHQPATQGEEAHPLTHDLDPEGEV